MAMNGEEAEQMMEAARQHPDQASIYLLSLYMSLHGCKYVACISSAGFKMQHIMFEL